MWHLFRLGHVHIISISRVKWDLALNLCVGVYKQSHRACNVSLKPLRANQYTLIELQRLIKILLSRHLKSRALEAPSMINNERVSQSQLISYDSSFSFHWQYLGFRCGPLIVASSFQLHCHFSTPTFKPKISIFLLTSMSPMLECKWFSSSAA